MTINDVIASNLGASWFLSFDLTEKYMVTVQETRSKWKWQKDTNPIRKWNRIDAVTSSRSFRDTTVVFRGKFDAIDRRLQYIPRFFL